MTEQELQNYSAILNKEKARIESELSAIAVKDPATPHGYTPKLGDVGGDTEDDTARETTETENNTALEHELKHQLDDILKAQEKISSGTYGVCDKCGNAITPDRLEAIPWTPFCINCAE